MRKETPLAMLEELICHQPPVWNFADKQRIRYVFKLPPPPYPMSGCKVLSITSYMASKSWKTPEGLLSSRHEVWCACAALHPWKGTWTSAHFITKYSLDRQAGDRHGGRTAHSVHDSLNRVRHYFQAGLSQWRPALTYPLFSGCDATMFRFPWHLKPEMFKNNYEDILIWQRKRLRYVPYEQYPKCETRLSGKWVDGRICAFEET